jgi:DNA ligase (NAD+)
MLSLNDVFGEEELQAWITRITKLIPPGIKPEYFMDIKMDGFACALVYEDGVFTTAITRGDGFVGEDVTANVRTLESVPLRLRIKAPTEFLKGRTEVRGEIVMYKADFEKLNQERQKKGQPLFANPRNTAAGTVRQLDPRLVASRPLNFRAYDLIKSDATLLPTHKFAYETLSQLGFLVNQQTKIAHSAKEIMQFANQWEEKRKTLPFNTDG